MALATAKAAPRRPDIKLSQALSDYESMLSAEQKQSFKSSPPDSSAVMALTCEIDRQNAGRKTRRCGARLTSLLNSVKGFTAIVDLIIGSAGNPIAGGVWGAVKIAMQVGIFPKTYLSLPLAGSISFFLFLLSIAISYKRISRLLRASQVFSTHYQRC